MRAGDLVHVDTPTTLSTPATEVMTEALHRFVEGACPSGMWCQVRTMIHREHRHGLSQFPASPDEPCPVRALQVDGDSEYQATVGQTCQKRGLRLCVLPPLKSLWHHIETEERAQRTQYRGPLCGQCLSPGDPAHR